MLLLLTLTGCDALDSAFPGTNPEPPVPQTQILDVRVEPNPVKAGETATFTCIISDSLDDSFEFTWRLDGVAANIGTDTNQVQWLAPDQPGVYSHRVSVRKDGPGEPVARLLETTVIE